MRDFCDWPIVFDRYGMFAYQPITIFGKNRLYRHIRPNAEYRLHWGANIISAGASIGDCRQAPIIGCTLLTA